MTKPSRNHKVVTHITIDGRRIELAASAIKKAIVDKEDNFVSFEDFN